MKGSALTSPDCEVMEEHRMALGGHPVFIEAEVSVDISGGILIVLHVTGEDGPLILRITDPALAASKANDDSDIDLQRDRRSFTKTHRDLALLRAILHKLLDQQLEAQLRAQIGAFVRATSTMNFTPTKHSIAGADRLIEAAVHLVCQASGL
jgi:hypothetical protein